MYEESNQKFTFQIQKTSKKNEMIVIHTHTHIHLSNKANIVAYL